MARQYTNERFWYLLLFILSVDICCIHSLNDIFSDKVFVSIWNAPTAVCERKYDIKLNVSKFGIIANRDDAFMGDNIVIFYKNKLGLYPWIDSSGRYINGGLPQFSNLEEHLQQVERDITHFIPNTTFTGLAVIDWEEWRPIFDRNEYNMKQKIYVETSMNTVRMKHPDWSDQRIENEARDEFETAAKLFMKSTLDLCKRLRPGGDWGFYEFPNCYNDVPGDIYCTNTTQTLNDRLWWLFTSSSVLLPSVYLMEDFGTHGDRRDKVYGTLEETLRVRQNYGAVYTPITPYTRFRYGDTTEFYDLVDLNNTVRQIAEAGLDGMVLWDSSFSIRSASDCKTLQVYLNTILGPFIVNVTDEARRCSQTQCSSHGRCFKDYKPHKEVPLHAGWFHVFVDFFRHLLKTFLDVVISWPITGDNGVAIHDDRTKIQDTIGPQCRCFIGWTGEKCDHRTI